MARRTLLTELSDYAHDRRSRRMWSLAARDGIITTAGVLLGFAGAGASDTTLIMAATAATVAGVLTAGGAEWAEASADREAELHALAEEIEEHRHARSGQKAELVQYYRDKGLSPTLAEEVARQLMVRSPLKAALESEHGILELTSRTEVWLTGITASLAYLLGAAIPFAMTFLLPVDVETWVILLAVLVSLTLTSIAGAQAGRMYVWSNILRTLVIGAGTIGISYAVGEIAF